MEEKKTAPLPLKDPRSGRYLFTNGKDFRYMGDLEAANQPTTETVVGERGSRKVAPWVRVTDQKQVITKDDKPVSDTAHGLSDVVTVKPVHTMLEALKAASTVEQVGSVMDGELRAVIIRAATVRIGEIEAASEPDGGEAKATPKAKVVVPSAATRKKAAAKRAAKAKAKASKTEETPSEK